MKRKNNNTDYSLAHVLYQKLGSDWYAFTEVDGDCFMSKVDHAVVENAKASFDAPESDSRDNRRKAA